jgi:hypothetical protein
MLFEAQNCASAGGAVALAVPVHSHDARARTDRRQPRHALRQPVHACMHCKHERTHARAHADKPVRIESPRDGRSLRSSSAECGHSVSELNLSRTPSHTMCPAGTKRHHRTAARS